MDSALSKFKKLVFSRKFRAGLVGFSIVFISFYIVALRPPANFPVGTYVRIEEGTTINGAAKQLEDLNVIHSRIWFRNFAYLLQGKQGILAGDYYFPRKRSVIGIAYALTAGNYGIDAVAVLVPEGAASYEIAELLDLQLTDFDKEAFRKSAQNQEGRLFPDTYFFLPKTNSGVVLEALEQNFNEKMNMLRPEIEAAGYTEEEALIMASILEKEARTTETRKIIAGILWKRIELGIPLQVDAVFGYIQKRPTFHPSHDDLEIDSPYNTYKYLGLPPGPISNPGVEAIRAAINPTATPYLFYLTDKNGVMRYAETFEGHKRNRALYLD